MKKKKIIIILLILIILCILIIIFSKLSIKFTLIGDEKVSILYNSEYKESGATFKLFGKDLSDSIKIDGKVDTSKVGDYQINYKAKLGFIVVNRKRIVRVIDNTKPILTLFGDEEVTICPNVEYKEDGYEAFDDYDGILTDKVIRTESKDEIKYKVSDTFGNTAILSRKIIRQDKENPTINLTGGTTTYIKLNSEYKEYGYTAKDNCDSDLTDKVQVTNNVDTSKIGEYEVVYYVKDSSQNETKVTRKVIVTDRKDLVNKEKNGVIYLTFDDGPNRANTTKILDVLKEENVKATFFVIGTTGALDLVKREVDEGHTVALHSDTHKYNQIYSSTDAFIKDLETIANKVKDYTGNKPTITRFPGGSNNTVSNKYSYGIMSILKEEVTNRGYTFFDWNVDSNDAGTCAKSSVNDKKTCVYNNVTKNLSKSRSNVVLMHDIKSYTADAIRDIIQYGKKNGYTFDVITEDTYQIKFH